MPSPSSATRSCAVVADGWAERYASTRRSGAGWNRAAVERKSVSVESSRSWNGARYRLPSSRFDPISSSVAGAPRSASALAARSATVSAGWGSSTRPNGGGAPSGAGPRVPRCLVGPLPGGGCGRGPADLAADGRGDDSRLLVGEGSGPAAALDDHAPEQALRVRRAGDAGHDDRASGLPGERDVARVTAEEGGVRADPAQRGDHVEAAAVVRRVRQPEETRDAEPVVDGDQDDPVAGERCAVVDRSARGAGDEGTAVHEYEYRSRRARLGGCPHVDREVVLPPFPAAAEERGEIQAPEAAARGLRRGRSRPRRVADPCPARVR